MSIINLSFQIGLPLWIFDLDNTIITTRSGKKFPKDLEDYKYIIRPKTSGRINLLVYSNQAKCPDYMSEKISRIKKDIQELCPNAMVSYIIATEKDKYRKPCPLGLQDELNNMDMSFLDFPAVFMVGDAAGRENDFADSDCKFSMNIKMLRGSKVYFFNPEEYKDMTMKYDMSDWDLCRQYCININPTSENRISYPYLNASPLPDNVLEKLRDKKLIIMSGAQGSGKSTLSKYLQKTYKFRIYEYSSTLKPNSILPNSIIDGTFPSKNKRQEFMDAFPGQSVVIYFDIPESVRKHNRLYREYHGREHISDVAVRMFQKKNDDPGCECIRITEMIFKNDDPEYELFYY